VTAVPTAYQRVILAEDGITVRPWSEQDGAAFLGVYSDETIARWLHNQPLADIDAARARLASVIERSEAMPGGLGIFALVPDELGLPVGSLLLKPLWETGLIEIGWHQATPWTGRGLVTRGARMLLRHAFEAVGLNEVHAIVLPDNERSLAVANRIGLTDTGERLSWEGLEVVLLRLARQQWAKDAS
jgi:RimJ/RimL family protein N-acetyltransferase